MSDEEMIVDTWRDLELISGSETSSEAEIGDDRGRIKQTARMATGGIPPRMRLHKVQDGKWQHPILIAVTHYCSCFSEIHGQTQED
jgi:hypothetical protein